MVAVWFIHSNYSEEMERSYNLTWESLMQEFLPTQFATSVRNVHPALQLPEKRLGEAMKIILRIIKGLSISDRKRRLCLVKSRKLVPGKVTPCLAIR